MKFLSLALMVGLIAFSATANAAPLESSTCVGIEIGAHYQVIPLDGTNRVAGELPIKEIAGIETNPLIAEATDDGVAFNVYEATIPAMLGQFLATYMTAQGSTVMGSDGVAGCALSIDGSLGKHKFAFIATSTRGDIILQNYDDQDPMSFLVIKKIDKR
jgi:hypothetical protein